MNHYVYCPKIKFFLKILKNVSCKNYQNAFETKYQCFHTLMLIFSALLTYGAWAVQWLRWPLESLLGASNTNKRYIMNCLWNSVWSALWISTKIMGFQVAALFHIGTTKSHPPIPDHLSSGAKDFLLKCLQKYAPFNFLLLSFYNVDMQELIILNTFIHFRVRWFLLFICACV